MALEKEEVCSLDLESQTPQPVAQGEADATAGSADAAAGCTSTEQAECKACVETKQHEPFLEVGMDAAEMDVAAEFSQQQHELHVARCRRGALGIGQLHDTRPRLSVERVMAEAIPGPVQQPRRSAEDAIDAEHLMEEGCAGAEAEQEEPLLEKDRARANVEPELEKPVERQADANTDGTADADVEPPVPKLPDSNSEEVPLLSSQRSVYEEAKEPLIDTQTCGIAAGVKTVAGQAATASTRLDCLRRLVVAFAASAAVLGVVMLVLVSYTNATNELLRFKWSSEEKMLELEQRIRATTDGKLPRIRDIRNHPVTENALREEMRGEWCEAVQLDPHYGVIDFADVCPSDLPDIHVADDSFPNVSPQTNREQFGKVRNYLRWHPLNRDNPHYWAALRALQGLSEFRAQDIFAFNETWTDEDTELLRKLDPTAWAWAPGNLTTEKLRAKLPSIGDLRKLVNADRVAIVGGADSLSGAGLGPEIDSHPHVVRFNEIVGEKLIANETGSKTTFHVSCSKVAPLGESGVAEFDLETDTVWRTWCGRMHANGEFYDVTNRPFLIRPSAYCVLSQRGAKMWTRGFLFYWFIGRLFKEVNMYGFSGIGHYHNDAPIWEKYLDFEHLFYRVNGLDAH